MLVFAEAEKFRVDTVAGIMPQSLYIVGMKTANEGIDTEDVVCCQFSFHSLSLISLNGDGGASSEDEVDPEEGTSAPGTPRKTTERVQHEPRPRSRELHTPLGHAVPVDLVPVMTLVVDSLIHSSDELQPLVAFLTTFHSMF